jgi:hypothetical protein
VSGNRYVGQRFAPTRKIEAMKEIRMSFCGFCRMAKLLKVNLSYSTVFLKFELKNETFQRVEGCETLMKLLKKEENIKSLEKL